MLISFLVYNQASTQLTPVSFVEGFPWGQAASSCPFRGGFAFHGEGGAFRETFQVAWLNQRKKNHILVKVCIHILSPV